MKVYKTKISLLFAVFLFCVRKAETLTCYHCLNATLISDCHTETDCGSGESCFMDLIHTSQGVRYSLGCRNDQQCPSNGNAGSIVGRSVSTQDTGNCQDCCPTTRCNKKLCSNDVTCTDSTDMNCETTNAMVDICIDTHHVKTLCRRYCGLCSLVDGKWSNWSPWTSCTATCGNTTQTRTRTCTNPAPVDGGLDCPGSKMETNSCSLELCPIHGAWSSWSSWGSCSVTCDIGMQRRDRSCSQPFPSRFGDHCYGDSRDDRICILGACADGGWSSWDSWSACSVTCGDGFQTRERFCNSPTPSTFGQYCQGDNKDISSCSDKKCPERQVAFSVTSSNTQLVNGVALFNTVITNIGGGYNVQTGQFTCTEPGVYLFSLTIQATSNNAVTYCYIRLNTSYKAISYAHTARYQSSTVDVILELNVGDVVDVGDCGAWNYVQTSAGYTVFNGVLITEG